LVNVSVCALESSVIVRKSATDAVPLYERVALADTTGVLVLFELFDPHPAVDKTTTWQSQREFSFLSLAFRLVLHSQRGVHDEGLSHEGGHCALESCN
jgi:hypothetical protein